MEKKVAETLLEEKQKIVIGGEVYFMHPPSIATLVLASKYIGQLPSDKLDKTQLIPEMIQNSDKLLPIGDAIAVMVLGAKGYNEIANPLLDIFTRKRVTKGNLLAEKIINDDIENVLKQFLEILKLMNLSDFFSLTTFLIDLNVTKRTRRVVK